MYRIISKMNNMSSKLPSYDTMDLKYELEKDMNLITIKLFKKIADTKEININIFSMPHLSETYYDELKISFEEKQKKIDEINKKFSKKIEEKKRLEEEEKTRQYNIDNVNKLLKQKKELAKKLEEENQEEEMLQINQQQEEEIEEMLRINQQQEEEIEEMLRINQQQEEIRQEKYFRSRGWGTMNRTSKQDFDDKFYGTGRWAKK